MRLLFTSAPGLGHLHPLLALALAAVEAGHDVRVATGEDRIAYVRRCGAHAEAAGLSHAALLERGASLQLTGPDRPRELFTTVAVPPMAADLLALVDRQRPDVLVHEEGEFAAPLVAALTGIPCVTQSWAAPARPAAGRQLIDVALRQVWQDAGASGPATQVGQLYLDACPPALQGAGLQHVDARVVAVRPSTFDGPPEPVPAWLAELPRPAVYVTLGTEPVFSRPALLQRLADAAADAVPGVVLSTGPHPFEVVRRPHAGVRGAQYVAQSHVLPEVEAVVSHGGAGTTAGALAHGRPLLVVPGDAPSQQGCAERVVAAGLGRSLAWQEATPANLRTAVTEVVGRDDLRATAQAVQAELAALPGPPDVVALLARER